MPLAVGTDYISREQHGKNLEEARAHARGGAHAGGGAPRGDASAARSCAGSPTTAGESRRDTSLDAVVLDEDPGDLSAFGSPER